jgi:hypothetical protein
MISQGVDQFLTEHTMLVETMLLKKKTLIFGSEIFDLPELNVKKEWNVGFYFGVVIDTRVAIELIKSLGSSK